MIPCKSCGPIDAQGRIRRGAKRVGKTRYTGSVYTRRYRCLDCGAECTMVGHVPRTFDVWTQSAETK